MGTFLNDVVRDLNEQKKDFSKLTFILPSKRAGTFLKHNIAKELNKTIFLPEITSIESFVESLSGLNYANNTELLFRFYSVYLRHTPKELQEPFELFSKWAQLLLQDFNEIDRYLISPNKIFDYLDAIKQIEHLHWSSEDNQTDYIKRYLSFWKRLKIYYHELNLDLIEHQIGYQGLVYREAIEHLEQFINSRPEDHFVFVGFNALNKAEEIIIQELLQQQRASIYWDIDKSFVDDPIHDAGLFIRAFKSKWNYFNTSDFNWLHNHFSEPKDIACIGISKNIGQVKYIGQLLSELIELDQPLDKTAIVLGDESLLIPLLNSLPNNVGPINITMGLPLHSIPMSSLFEELFRIHNSERGNLYHKDVISIISNQFIKPLFLDNGNDVSNQIIEVIRSNNILYISVERLVTITKSKAQVLELLFSSWGNDPNKALSQCRSLVMLMKSKLEEHKSKHLLSLEYLYRLNVVFNELIKLNNDFTYIKSIATLFGLYKELLKNETLDFQGEPLDGLQIMGMLESRVLDFERVIIASVNEGILPAGKSYNSFIPFDVKLENEMPTYKEKDAVYTYHFYRLIQRAKHIHIIYNTEPDVLNGGEKSRFITQLDIDPSHSINHITISPSVESHVVEPTQIIKSKDVINQLHGLAAKGFSPSSLTNYIRNPIAFYYEKVLGIKQFEDVEENIAYNTLGTVVHNTLEEFYGPITGQFLTEGHLKDMRSKVDDTVMRHFRESYKEGDVTKGKNLIIFEIAKHFISQFLELEKQDLIEGNTIEIIAVETKSDVPIFIEELGIEINLTGKVDRVDRFNGQTRIIDYKTGSVDSGKVNVYDWELLTSDYNKYSKSFQLLMYAYMMQKEKKISLPVEAGIFSFKKLNSGLVKFATKPSKGSKTKDYSITHETMEAFEGELKKLLIEIFNKNIPFIEKDVDQ
ncbi:MAG: PD-(D/E)XK nuclease family protein [Psychroserpens sp.]|nr:PD-(D/E)XK nuclease family protein [Psychroserpens sp.]